MKIKSTYMLLVGFAMTLLFASGCSITGGSAFTIGKRCQYHDVIPTDRGLYYLSATTLSEYNTINSNTGGFRTKTTYIWTTSLNSRTVIELNNCVLKMRYNQDGKLQVRRFEDVVGDLYVNDKSNSSKPSLLIKFPIDYRGYKSPYIIWDGMNTNGNKTNSTLEAGDIPWIYYKAIAVGLNHKGFPIVELTPSPIKSKTFTAANQLMHHEFESILKNTTPDYILEVNILKTKRHYLRKSIWDLPYQDFELTTELKLYDSKSKKLISQSIVNSVIPDDTVPSGGWIPYTFISVLERHFSEVINDSIFESLNKKIVQTN